MNLLNYLQVNKMFKLQQKKTNLLKYIILKLLHLILLTQIYNTNDYL